MVGCQAGKGHSWAWATGCDGSGGHPLPPSLSLASFPWVFTGRVLCFMGGRASAPGRLGDQYDSERSAQDVPLRAMTWVVSGGL